MLDFVQIVAENKKGRTVATPKFKLCRSKDLMIRGRDFYAVWDEDNHRWATDEQTCLDLIDKCTIEYAQKLREVDTNITVNYMWDASNCLIDMWHKYCQKQTRDNYHQLDQTLIFGDHAGVREDYASKNLDYSLQDGTPEAWNKILTTLYDEEEANKIRWAIGAVVSGDSKTIQKFLVLYGKAGTGKSTILNIILSLFKGYCCTFDAKALGSATGRFALESFRTNPLVAIQQDGDLSHIEDNTRLNSLTSHEAMVVDEKYKSSYEASYNCMLFMGTNKPVKITDMNSGILRRLIDVIPSGRRLTFDDYQQCMAQIPFELGMIANDCLKFYEANKRIYDEYRPVRMMQKTNDLAVFVDENCLILDPPEGLPMAHAWDIYKQWAEDHKFTTMNYRVFKSEIANYYRELIKDSTIGGYRYHDILKGLRLETENIAPVANEEPSSWLIFDSENSLFDAFCEDCPAQYSVGGAPKQKWENVKTILADLDTRKEHYVLPPQTLVMVDFDLKKEGVKDRKLNEEAASTFYPTYAELSRSGAGIHLIYIYTGDPAELAQYQDSNPDIEIKVYSGKSAIRRMLTKCNRLPIASISSGLTKKTTTECKAPMLNFNNVESERTLMTTIRKVLTGELQMHHKPGVDFIANLLNKAYTTPGLKYDLSEMQNACIAYASRSTHHARECRQTVMKLHFQSKDYENVKPDRVESDLTVSENKNWRTDNRPIYFFDVECFPNLFLINYKKEGKGEPVQHLVNPKPNEIEPILKLKLIGFNNRYYDNHMVYAAYLGYSNEALFKLSSKLVDSKETHKPYFAGAYNLSYTDVYDYASAAHKMSLKKWEVKLHIHHKELGLPWDKPVPEELWPKVISYCDNDVTSTEAVHNHLKGDFMARVILAIATGMTPNDTTNALTGKLVFKEEENPQTEFNYRFLGDLSNGANKFIFTKEGEFYHDYGDDFTLFDNLGRPVFPGYVFDSGISTYRGEEIGEGGYVYAEPGIYYDVALLDVASMHPSSAIAEELFGPRFTQRFKELKTLRISIKHKDFETAKTLLDGVFAEFIDGDYDLKDLVGALKTAINAVYGLTAAKFANIFRDPRNVDNIVAKRGALFMVNLKHAVQERGFKVAHIKTDSIKIPNATPEIIEFVMDYGKMYGYDFEHEATYRKMCLVNDAVYIAQYDNGEWTATGTQFAVPYVFKTLFSNESINIDDLTEVKQVKTGDMFLDMNESMPDVSAWEALKKARDQYAKDPTKLTKKAVGMVDEYSDVNDISLENEIAKGHSYRYVGRVCAYCPVISGAGGGRLVVSSKDTDGDVVGYKSVTGANGFRWIEREDLTEDDIDKIDISYYKLLADKAKETISKYGNFDEFVNY